MRLQALPQDGQANAALLAYLAEVFGAPKSHVALLSGHTARFKIVDLAGVNPAQPAAVRARHRAP